MSDAEEITTLLEDMRSGEENRLISAAPMLAEFGVAAISGLLDTLKNPQPLVRDYSAWALGMIGSSAESAIPALCRATQDTNSSVRYAAIMALNNIGKPTDEVTNCCSVENIKGPTCPLPVDGVGEHPQGGFLD